MLILLCKLWPYLLGGLIGWLLCGWVARRLKYCPGSVERIVEKEVTVEKLIDNPESLRRIAALEGELAIGQNATEIDLAAAKAAGITIKAIDDFRAIEGIGPKINDLIHADGIHSFCELSRVESSRLQKILDAAGSNYRMANPGTWPDQATLACNNRWPALKALQDILVGGVYPDLNALKRGDSAISDNSKDLARISDLENQLEVMRKGPAINTEVAKAAGFRFKSKENSDHVDFTVIEGIGPKIDGLIHAASIHSYQTLSMADVAQIQKILDDAGPNYKLAKPSTWPAQSGLAASNQWEALKAWQDILDGGEE